MENLESNTIADNNQVFLLEKARLYNHQLQSCRAAFRFLEGSVLTGIVESEAANKIVPDIIKFEQKLFNKNQFANDFFELAGKPLFKETINKKYKKLKQRLPRITNKRILVIDDKYAETGWKQVFSLLFGKDAVVGQNNSKTAIKYLGENSKNVLCILLDLRLPKTEEQGIELLKEINNYYPQIPVVIFSGSDSIIYARQVFKLGAWDYYPKEPVDTEHRNPIDYFITFFDIITNVWDYDKNYVVPFWKKIIDLEELLQQFENQQGAGLSQLTIRELKKAYKHFVYEKMNIFTPSFLEMNLYDEVIYCCAKSFESYVKLYAVSSGITKEERTVINYSSGKAETSKQKNDILKSTKGLKELIEIIKNNNGTLKISLDWFGAAENLVIQRNKYIHGSTTESSYKSGKIKPANEEVAKLFFENTLKLISELKISTI